MLVIAAEPLQELLAALVLGDLDGEVTAHQPDAAPHEIADDPLAFGRNEGMPAAAVGVEKDAAGAVEGFLLVGPAVFVKVDLQSRRSGQAFLQQQSAGVELVLSGRMTGSAGENHQFLRLRSVGCRGC